MYTAAKYMCYGSKNAYMSKFYVKETNVTRPTRPRGTTDDILQSLTLPHILVDVEPNSNLPDSDLLAAINYYATFSAPHLHSKLDSTVLLLLGIIIEELAADYLGHTGNHFSSNID
ncbi:hypothetical protein CANCADRAFT_30192 [Tortispora caseinolytica NRRL Y-17796]|uniref:Uncharacterized protein n=1 Tax=Tortispora caseinolytica NRRL Y-17796 TaxID=767744 RepID=A0A1E4TJH4_9ASCO|nr:hypothetical protein CANCADRAFT_30192 [Tortispora caseinolytica NRRL Y-17796]